MSIETSLHDLIRIFLPLQTIVQSECIIRGDLANINIGRQCIVGKRAVITPPFKKLSHGYGP